MSAIPENIKEKMAAAVDAMSDNESMGGTMARAALRDLAEALPKTKTVEQVIDELDGKSVKLTFNARPLERQEAYGILIHAKEEGGVRVHTKTETGEDGTVTKTYLSLIRYNEITSICPAYHPAWEKE